MHHPAAVGVAQRTGHLPPDREHVLQRKLPVAGNPLTQRFALDEGHHIVEVPLGLAGVDQGEDMGMAQPGRYLDLAQEALGADVGSEVGMEDLHRYRAAVLLVLGEVDCGHAATADFPLQAVARSQDGIHPVDRFRQRSMLRKSS